MQELLDGKFLDDVVYNVLLGKLAQCVECCSLVRHVEHKVLLRQEPRILYVELGLVQLCRVCMIQQCEQWMGLFQVVGADMVRILLQLIIIIPLYLFIAEIILYKTRVQFVSGSTNLSMLNTYLLLHIERRLRSLNKHLQPCM